MLNRVFICLTLAFPGVVAAFDVLPIDTFYSPILSNTVVYSSLNYANSFNCIGNATLCSDSNNTPVDTPGGSKSTKVPPPESRGKATATIAKLVKAYPAPVRPRTKKAFAEIFANYSNVEKFYGIPKYDLAGAVAIFIAANYEGFINVEVPDADVRTLVGQVRGALQNSPRITKLKPNKKREAYQQFAILGVFMALVQEYFQQQPNPTLELNYRDACRLYLEQFLNVNADNLVLNSQGLALIQ
jgi:hypothetical protein